MTVPAATPASVYLPSEPVRVPCRTRVAPAGAMYTSASASGRWSVESCTSPTIVPPRAPCADATLLHSTTASGTRCRQVNRRLDIDSSLTDEGQTGIFWIENPKPSPGEYEFDAE